MTENVKTNERWYKSENRLFHAKTVTNKSTLWCGLSPYMSYQTPASRHAEVAAGPVYPSYHYTAWVAMRSKRHFWLCLWLPAGMIQNRD